MVNENNNEIHIGSCTIFKGVDDSTEPIPNGILRLGQSVFVWALNENCNTAWVTAVFDESVLVLSLKNNIYSVRNRRKMSLNLKYSKLVYQNMLVNDTGVAQTRFREIIK